MSEDLEDADLNREYIKVDAAGWVRYEGKLRSHMNHNAVFLLLPLSNFQSSSSKHRHKSAASEPGPINVW